MVVPFEKLVSSDASERREAAAGLLSRTLSAPAPDNETLNEIYNIAKESQRSKTRHDDRLARRIRTQVQKWDLDYKGMLEKLETV